MRRANTREVNTGKKAQTSAQGPWEPSCEPRGGTCPTFETETPRDSHGELEEPSPGGNAGDSGKHETQEGPERCSPDRGLLCSFILGGPTDRVSRRQLDSQHHTDGLRRGSADLVSPPWVSLKGTGSGKPSDTRTINVYRAIAVRRHPAEHLGRR